MILDIVSQIGKEIRQFDDDNVYIAGVQEETGRYLNRKSKGYYFNQKKTLSTIDLYTNDKYETGEIDSEGQRKLFLNKCSFATDVASNQIDLDTSNFLFIPDDKDHVWSAFFIQKKFKKWARLSYFGEFINELVDNFPKYGTLVVKRVGKKLERVHLRHLKNQQDAESLQTAKFVIQEHPNMSIEDMKKYPDWDVSGIKMDYGEVATVYERYGLIPAEDYFEITGGKCPKNQMGEMYETLVVATCRELQKKPGNNKDYEGQVLFMEKVKERPYIEAHWKKVDGRWLGKGEVETQFENQVASNMISNMRTRSLKHGSRKVFQTQGDTVAKNLLRDVKDGDVLEVGVNGLITQVDQASRASGEYQAAENSWNENSNQKSFTFEVATGESMPSATPFRLGVILSNAANTHFGKKKEQLGLFLKKLVVEDVYDIFLQESREEHTLAFMSGEEGFEMMKNLFIEREFGQRIIKWALSDSTEIPDWTAVRTVVEEGYGKHKHLFVPVPKDFYKDAKINIELTITGEEIDVASKVTTLTTLYTSLLQAGDPRADKVLERIMALQGENLEVLLGPKAPPAQSQQIQQGNTQQLSPINNMTATPAQQTL